MALTPAQIDALATYTSAQQLKIWQRASIELATAGVSNAINNRTLTRNNAREVEVMLNYWTERAAVDAAAATVAGSGGDNVLVRFEREG